MMYTFTMVITKEGKWHIAEALELGVISQGKTIEEAEANLREAVELYLEHERLPKKQLAKHPPLVSVLRVEYA